ncbi:hypothetical protein [Nodularia sp. LEGE 04288]|nr:hypothetical protein [Nodularia sp. LEGE 04288]MCC2692874.1 hypothetical protein [Nodularia sp. LEGE 04288]
MSYSCQSISRYVPLAFSGCASASITHQAVTLDYAVKVLWSLGLPRG